MLPGPKGGVRTFYCSAGLPPHFSQPGSTTIGQTGAEPGLAFATVEGCQDCSLDLPIMGQGVASLQELSVIVPERHLEGRTSVTSGLSCLFFSLGLNKLVSEKHSTQPRGLLQTETAH